MHRNLLLSFALASLSAAAVAQSGNNSNGMPAQSMPSSQAQAQGAAMAPGMTQQPADPSQGAADKQSASSDDAALQKVVQQQLLGDPALSGVQAAAHKGRVTLTGTVATKQDRNHAENMVKSVPGVKDVKTHLTVGDKQSASPSSTGASTSPAAGSGQNTAGSISGNAPSTTPANSSPNISGPPAGSTPPTVPQNNTTPPQTISENGRGARLVNASYQEAASSNPPSQQDQSSNATAVHPNTSMGPTPTAVTGPGGDNSALQSQIDGAIRNEPTLSNSHVSVNVTGDIIELSGTVPTAKDKLTAERIARSYASNRKVNDNLAVTGHGHSDMAPDHPAMNNSGTGNAVKPAQPAGNSNQPSTPPQP